MEGILLRVKSELSSRLLGQNAWSLHILGCLGCLFHDLAACGRKLFNLDSRNLQ